MVIKVALTEHVLKVYLVKCMIEMKSVFPKLVRNLRDETLPECLLVTGLVVGLPDVFELVGCNELGAI